MDVDILKHIITYIRTSVQYTQLSIGQAAYYFSGILGLGSSNI